MSEGIVINVDLFLYRKIQKVAKELSLSIEGAVIFLLAKVITPSAEEARETRSASLHLCVKGKKGARKVRRSSAVFPCPRGANTPARRGGK